MMILSIDDSKRQRRPNVRVGEIGDASAAFSFELSENVKKDFHWEKNLDYGFLTPEESEYNYISEFCQERACELDVSDHGVSPWFSVDRLQNQENVNPNFVSFISKFDEMDEVIIPEQEFGTVAQKCVLACKGRRGKRCKRTAFGDYWNSEVISQTNTEDEGENEHQRKGISATSEEACEADTYEPTFSLQNGGNTSEIWKEGDNSLSSVSFRRYDSVEGCGSDVISVGKWLEDLGYGKYTSLFERHEVDEEALPLLTLDDLKEMGVVAVGPRWKLYTAIQQLRHS